MSPRIVQVKESLQEIKSAWEHYGVEFSYEAVNVGGYPFASYVEIDNPFVKYTRGEEDFRIGLEHITLYVQSDNRYSVTMADVVITFYARKGVFKKEYDVTYDGLPALVLMTQGAATTLTHIKGLVTDSVTLYAYADSRDKRDIVFNKPSYPVPVYYDIHKDPRRSIELVLFMLTEAFKTPRGAPYKLQ